MNPSELAAQNQNECFDVVDENDQVIGQDTRGRVHALRLRHRAVHVLLFNDQKEVLLQRRSPAKDKFPNCWDSSCSGHLDRGEDYAAAAQRELHEELGIESVDGLVRDWTRRGKISARPETGQEFVEVFVASCCGPFHPSVAEISEIRWFSTDALKTLMESARPTVADALAYLYQLGWIYPPDLETAPISATK